MNNFWRWLSVYPVIFSAAAILAVCVLFSGCYTLKQGVTLLGYLNRAVPLERIDDEQFASLVTDIRKFAAEELGLVMSKNYTRYVELDRDYLAAVVSATAKDSFHRHEWTYPIVGRMPYKGFFNVEDARRERDRLEKKDLDVWIRGVDAFSTLGWFTDPLYSYMRNYSPASLANLIIHESLHATVFIKGQAQFNEELAEFVGTQGARLYVQSRYGEDSDQYREIFTSEEESQNYTAFIQELAAELEAVYSSSLSREEKLTEKERIIAEAQERFEREYDSRFSSGDYRGFSRMSINNAYIDLFRLYHAQDNFFADLYERAGKNLPAFIAAAKTLTARGDPRAQLENALLK